MEMRTKSWALVAIIITVAILVLLGSIAYLSNHSTSSTSQDNDTDRLDHATPSKELEHHGGHERGGRSMSVPNSTTAERCNEFEWECNVRLMTSVSPVHYDVFLHPDIPNGTFSGFVTILLDVTKNVNHLRIHVKDLVITNTSLTSSERSHDIQEVFIYEPNEFLVIRSVTTLEPGQYNLTVNFEGSLRRGIIGFYRSEYFDPVSNQTQYVVTTKFQPTYARRAFPCLDEPGFKSTFSVSLVKPSYLTALSNMPVLPDGGEEHDQPEKGFTTVHFQKSVPMVTYLLAVAIGDFDSLSGKSERGVPVRVFSTRFQLEKARYAISILPRIIDFYEKYFDIEYPLPKLDIIGIPDFVSGAMEHWGLISFRESALFYDTVTSSVGNKQRVASVLAHELAHMWFGNLMTLKWWTDLWLNEGFASYCEYKAVNHVHPDWEMEAQFLSLDLTPVMVLDAQQSSHPILQEVSHPDQITELFDTISYNKGASVIRMLEYFIGPEKFQKGVSKFLKDFSYKNAETKDLWKSLESEVGEGVNITFLMDTWTRQMGYPILRTETKDGQLTIHQERYLTNSQTRHAPSVDSPFNYRWEIPLRINSGNDSRAFQTVVMNHSQEKVVIPITHSGNWTKLNGDYFGYFRVQYSENAWKDIKTVFLEEDTFSPAERCGLIDDIFSFAYSSEVAYDLALDFSQALTEDSHLVPWDCASRHLRQISSLLRNAAPDTYVSFRKYISNLTATLYKRFTWIDSANETHLDGLLKIRIFALACSHGHEGCLENAKRLFDDWIQNAALVPPGIRPVVYKWGMWQANSEAWDILWNRYLNESDAQERVRLLNALAFTQQNESLRRFIDLAGNESFVRRQDFFTAMNAVANNPVGNSILWKYYRDEYEHLVKRFTANDRYFGRMILGITSYYSSQIHLRELTEFLDMHREGGAGKRARETALETVQNNFEWQKRNVPIISKWLTSNNF